jgi:hypothetical protein
VLIELFEQERAQLEGWARRRSSAQALAQRSQVVLLASQGLNNSEIALALSPRGSHPTQGWSRSQSRRRRDKRLFCFRRGRPRGRAARHL